MKKLYFLLLILTAVGGTACLHGCGTDAGKVSTSAHTIYGATS